MPRSYPVETGMTGRWRFATGLLAAALQLTVACASSGHHDGRPDASVGGAANEAVDTPPEESRCPALSGLALDSDPVVACQLLVLSHLGRFPQQFNFVQAMALVQDAARLHALVDDNTSGRIADAEFQRRWALADEDCTHIAGVACLDVFQHRESSR